MKNNQKNTVAGLTLLEMTVVGTVILALMAILFTGARAWHEESRPLLPKFSLTVQQNDRTIEIEVLENRRGTVKEVRATLSGPNSTDSLIYVDTHFQEQPWGGFIPDKVTVSMRGETESFIIEISESSVVNFIPLEEETPHTEKMKLTASKNLSALSEIVNRELISETTFLVE